MAKESSKQQGRKGQATPFWETVVGVIGLLMVLGVLGFLVYEALQPTSPPAIELHVEGITQNAGGYLVQVQAANRGGSTAAAVVVEGSLLASNAAAAQPVETSEITIDYIPENSSRQAGLFFAEDPAQYRLELRVKGYVEP
ncbi:MAG TPA: hypothetical protein VNK95_06335 [Caldilineaceae bacterium]|nr:hypothetical protein [Caldilineaceae bacterium]